MSNNPAVEEDASRLAQRTVELDRFKQRLAQETARHQQAQKALHQINRAYKVLSECNQVVVQATEETALLQETCRIIVEEAGYRLAWVGLAEQDEPKTVRPVAQKGYEAGYLNTVNVTWADTDQHGRGPTGRAIRTGQPALVHHILTDPNYEPWRAEAIRRGYASTLALPLCPGRQAVLGALVIYATEPDAFDTEEVNLLLETANILAHGMMSLRARLEWNRTEKALKKERDRSQQYLDLVGVMVVALDAQGRVILINQTGYQLLGYAETELLGQNWFTTCLPQPDQERVWSVFEQLMAGKIAPFKNYENVVLTKGGEQRLIAWHNTVLRDDDGAISGILSAGQDVTEQRRAEAAEKQHKEALRHSEERFRQVIVSISDHIYVTRVAPDGTPTNLYLSPHLETLTGHPLQKFEERWDFWPSQVIHPADRHLAAEQMGQLRQGHNSQAEYRLVKADGRVIWVRDSARVQQEGDHLVIYGLVSDITARKEAEEQIRQLNEGLEQRVLDRTRELAALYDVSSVASESLKLDKILEHSLERVLAAMRSRIGCIYLLDESGHSLGLATQKNIPAQIAAQIDPLPVGQGLAGWVIEHGEPLLVPDLRTDSRAPAAAIPNNLYSYIGAPMRARSKAIGVLGMWGGPEQQFSVEEVALLASIADQIGVAVENARLRQRARQAAVMEERERLSRELHDSVTQSLYSLTLFAEAGQKMIETGQTETLRHNLARIGQMGQQALKEMRLLVHELRPLDLAQEGLIGALHRRLKAVEDRANVKARLVAEELLSLPSPVEEELYRIAQEALNNALKHAKADEVTIYLRQAEETVEMEVIDNGIGFEPEQIGSQGGLGLDTMRERASRLNGSLVLSSGPNGGTRVKVTIKPAPPDKV